MSRLLTGLLGLTAGGGIGYGVGSKLQKRRSGIAVENATQKSELATKLRERSDSSNRRLRVENYYIRRALNELAKKRLPSKEER